MAVLLDGKFLAKKISQNLKVDVEELKKQELQPKLAVIMVGQDAASQIYVRNKSKACEEVGIEFEEYLLEETSTMDELLDLINTLNEKKDVNGILLQSPIPSHMDINKAFRAIAPEKDVDGFHPMNVGKLSLGQDCFVSCTPYGIVKLLEEYQIPIEGKHCVILRKK